jgi:hypothetical protein
MKTSTGGNRGNGERIFYKNSVVSVNYFDKAMHPRRNEDVNRRKLKNFQQEETEGTEKEFFTKTLLPLLSPVKNHASLVQESF